MQTKFDSTLSSIAPTGKILLAVSGGVDSMCMAYLFLHSGIPGMKERIGVAHCNFHLRGEESDADERLVKDWCSRNGIPFHGKGFDTEEYATRNGISTEMAARELRYNWFAELATEKAYSFVSIAHNANDNAETLLLNLVRGTGIKGICGMYPTSSLPSKNAPESLRLLRPLLGFTRKEILSLAEESGIPYREDRTNAEEIYKRNRIRHSVIPVLEQLNPSLLQTLSEDMEHFREVADIADEFLHSAIERVSLKSEQPGKGVSPLTLSRQKLSEEKFLHFILHSIMSPMGFTSSQVKSLQTLITMESGTFSGKSFLSEGGRILTSKDTIIIYRYTEDAFGPIPDRDDITGSHTVEMDVSSPGKYSLDGTRFEVETLKWEKGMSAKQPEGTIILDNVKISFPLHIRHWQDGDWMRPFGMKGRKKKLSDIFVDLGLSLSDKENVLVLSGADFEAELPGGEKVIVPDNHIIGILGYRISEEAKIDQNTASIIKIRLKKN